MFGSAMPGIKLNLVSRDKSPLCNEISTYFTFSNATNTDPQFLEYDTFLNGYVGLAENSHIARYDNTLTTGKLTIGGVTEGKDYVMQENENQVGLYGSYPYRDNLKIYIESSYW